MAEEADVSSKPKLGPVKDKRRECLNNVPLAYGYVKKTINTTSEQRRENLGRIVDNNDGVFGPASNPRDPESVELSLNKKGRWRLADAIAKSPEDFRGDYDKVCVVKNEKWALSGFADRCKEYHEFSDDMEIHRRAKKTYSREECLTQKPKPPRNQRRQDQNVEDEEPEVSRVQYEISTGCHSKRCRESDINAAIKGKSYCYPDNKPRQTLVAKHHFDLDDIDTNPDYSDYYYEEDNPENVNLGVKPRPMTFEADLLDAIPFKQVKIRKKNKRVRNCSEPDLKDFVRYSTSSDSADEDPSTSFEVVQAPARTLHISLNFQPEMAPVSLYIKESDLKSDCLVENFKDNYTESACIPRTFAVNITADARKALEDAYGTRGMGLVVKAQVNFQIVPNAQQLFSPLPGYQAVMVWINCLVVDDVMTLDFNTVFDQDALALDEVIDRAVKCLTMLPLESFPTKNQFGTGVYLSAVRKLEPDVTCIPPEAATDSIMNTSILKTLQRQLTRVERYMSSVFSPETVAQYCNVCYEELTPASGAFAMATCEHWFCVACWRNYLGQQVFRGSIKITCPEYDCDTLVPFDILPLALPQRVCNIHAEQLRDHEVNRASNTNNEWRWCINPRCQRLLKVDHESVVSKQYLACVCGSKWCPDCLKEPHFPASCKLNECYEKQLEQYGDASIAKAGEQIRFVSVKHCPHCKTPMEKGEGCNHISCRCGKGYCWSCLGHWDPSTGYDDHSRCANKSRRGAEEVQLVDVFSSSDLISKKNYKTCVVHRHARCLPRLKKLRLALEMRLTVDDELIQRLEATDMLARINVVGTRTTPNTKEVARFFVSYYRQCHYLLEFINVWASINKQHSMRGPVKSRAVQAAFLVERFEEACLGQSVTKIFDILGHLERVMQQLLRTLHKIHAGV